MNWKIKVTKTITSLLTLFLSFNLQAQDAEMADTMRSEGKIYVVVSIVLVILLGLIGYLIFIDRKVSNLEKRLKENNH